MAISAQDVNKLRQMTGAGMMDCKKALVEADGDFEKAIEILRKKGQKVSAARSGKEASEGSVFIKTSEDSSIAVLIALNCETDFVAKNEEFQQLGEQIVSAAYAHKPAGIDELLALDINGTPISEKITSLVGKIGEKIEISEFVTLEGEVVIPYIHAGSKLGVLVALKNANGSSVEEAGKDVAMQIAAMNPVAVDKDDVDSSVIEKELEIGREQAKAEGKPDNIIDKIAEGKLSKFFKESTLLNQQFVKDNSITIAKYLDGVHNGLTVSAFKRVTIG